jgi:serine/threonine protein kinase
MADLVGQQLGNYRIESLLGSGGMGDVYRAVHIRLDRSAAIKVMHTSQASDATFQARFLREARAAAALSHPNIVEVFDFGEQDGASYLVMELVPDGSLRSLLKQRAKGQGWSLGMGVDLVKQAALGLAYAHAHGMVHRDIKPDNLLLQQLEAGNEDDQSIDERYQLKISDFGLARMVEDEGDLTVTGVVMGTPTYMSPEQCQGGALDGRSDLYSLGVVLYEVATGSPPFRIKTLSEAVFKHISAAPIPLRELLPELPVALEEVILRCLEKRPEDRYATGTELAEALEGSLGDTELRTIITTRRSSSAGTPTPASFADPSAPTEAASGPRSQASGPKSQASGSTRRVAPPPKAPGSIRRVAPPPQAPIAEDDATIRASVPPASPASAAPVRTASASPKWPQPGSSPEHDAQDRRGFALSLLARPQTIAISIISALAVIAIVVVSLSAGHTTGKSTLKRGTPTATTPPAPTSTPVEQVVFQDPFKTSDNKWEEDSHAFYSNGGYELAGAWFTFSPVSNVGNGTVSVRMRWLSGPSDQYYGILFRSPNTSFYYVYGISQNSQWTFSLVSNGNGSPIVPPTTCAHIVTGAGSSNTIAIRARGSHFVFYINGVQVGEVTNGAIGSGRVGLINTVGDLNVVYNDFVVTASAS